MVNVLFSARDALWSDYEGPLQTALTEVGIKADIRRTGFSEDEVCLLYTSDAADE